VYLRAAQPYFGYRKAMARPAPRDMLPLNGLSIDGVISLVSVQPGGLSRARAEYDDYWSADGFRPRQSVPFSLRSFLAQNVAGEDACVDVGCGRGEGPSAWLAEHAGSYVGVDVSKVAVEAARANGLRAEIVDDASRLPFPDDSFDVGTCLEVLEHMHAPQLTAKEIYRVLKPGGRVLVTVPNVAYWRRRADLAVLGRWNPVGDDQSAHRPWRDPHLRFFGRANLVAMLSEAGFVQVTSGGHGASWMTDVPGVRALMRREDPGPLYRRLVAAFPGLFAHHLHAVGVKPTGD
jgi:SAM-dependent methyltransferase